MRDRVGGYSPTGLIVLARWRQDRRAENGILSERSPPGEMHHAVSGAVDAATLYKEHAQAAGIDINVVREPDDAYWDNVWLKKPWCGGYWSGRPTCDWMFTTVYAKGAAWNETMWANPRFNELLVAARGETDEQKRKGMYAEMQQLVHDDGGVIVIVFNNYVDAASKKLAHGKIAPNWECDGLKIAERWWFA